MESTATADDFAADSSQKTSRAPRLFIKEMVMRNSKFYAGEHRIGPFHKELRPLSQLNLERVLSATEYGRLSPQSSGWPFRRGSGDYQELYEVKTKTTALQMQQFVGEEKNDLLDYLRSLQPERVRHTYTNND